MGLRYYVLSALLSMSLWTMAQKSDPVAGKYIAGEGSGYARSPIQFGVLIQTDPNPVCELSATTLTATVKGEGIFQYSWKKIDSEKVYSASPSLFFEKTTPGDAGRYYCLVNDGRQTVSSDTLELQVIALPTAQIARPNVSDTTICYGDTLMLMGTSDVSEAILSWEGSHLFPTSNPNIVRVAPVTETVYTLKADNKGCYTTDTIHLRINTPFVDIPSIINTSEGNKIEITARDRDGQPILNSGNSLVWYKDGQRLSTVNPLQIQPKSDMEITVKYTAGGCSATGKSRLLIKGAGSYRGGNDDGFSTTCLPPVIIAQHGIEREQCVSLDSTELVVVAEGTNIRYQWQKLDHYTETFQPFVPPIGSDISGINAGILKIRKVSDNINGLYRCVLTNACATEEVISDTFNVSIKGEPIIKSGINIGRDQCVASGKNVTWNIIAEASAGTGHLTYRWYKDGRQISPEADTLINYYQFQITDPNGSEQGTYVVHVANECGTAGDTAFLPVVFPPKATACSRDVYACTGGEAEFTVQPEHNGDYIYTLYKYDLKNDKFGEQVASGSSRIVLSNVTASGHYRWIITHPYCGINTGSLETQPGRSDVMYLLVEKAPQFLVQPSPIFDTVCLGSTVEYNCVAKNTTTGDYAQPIRYNWYREGVLLNPTPQTTGTLILNNVTTDQSGIYYCTAFNSCPAVKSEEVNLKVTGKPQFAGSPTTLSEYCTGETISFRASLSALYPVDSVRWFFAGKPLSDIPGRFLGTGTPELTIDSVSSDDESGIFQLRAYNRCGYSSSGSVSFKVRQPARFIHSLDNNSVKMVMCSGENQTLTVEASGTPPLRFTWLLNGDTLVNSRNNVLDITGANLNDKGKYSCHVQNSCGDELTSTYIEISRPDTFRLVGGGDFCTNNEGVSIYLEGSDTNAIYRLYNKAGKQLLKEVEGKTIYPPFSKITFENLSAGTYYVTATDTNSCEYRMPGEAVIRENQIPTQFNLLVKRHICPGAPTGDLQLSGSQQSVEYALCIRNRWTWDTVAVFQGSGAPVNLTDLPAGDYKVHARNMLTGCHQDMPVIATLTERPAPTLCSLAFSNNDSTYCINTASNVSISYPCYENGNSYQLYRNNQPSGGMITSNSLHWTNLGEGRYEIKITNPWGCSATTNSRQVITQALPHRFQLIGTHYFCDYDQDSCFIELNQSKAGIRYSFYRLNGSILADTLSHGGPIRIGLWPPQEARFYVIATDTTPEHCSVAMADTVSLIKSRLQVVPVSPVTVNYNDSKQLNIEITGYRNDENDLQIQWDNREHLISQGENTNTPLTVAMTQSHFFPVTVNDANCQVRSGVQVNCIGGDLQVDIKDADCITATPDTLHLCGDATLSLCGMASGGATGNYTYRWWDDTKELSHTARLNLDSKTTDGYLWVEATDHNEKICDSIWIVVNESPRVDTLLQKGLLCIPNGSPVVLTLKKSLSTASYQVEYKADGSEWKELPGLVQNGTDGHSIEFMIHDAMNVIGRLRIKAAIPTKTGDGFCEKIMFGETEVRRGAADFTTSGNGAYCSGEITETTVSLDGSENGITYHLISSASGNRVASQTGNGGPLAFKEKLPAGVYRIVAETAYCRDTMPGQALVVEYPLPVIDSLIGAGHHCTSEGDIFAGINNGLKNTVYKLTFTSLNGISSIQDFYGEKQISLGPLSQPGIYTVTATDTLTGCQFTDPRQIEISDTPAGIHFEGEGRICGSGTTPVHLKIYPVQSGVIYTLIKVPSTPIAVFSRSSGDSLWYDGNLDSGAYIVKAQLDRCERIYTDTLIIDQHPLPEVDIFTGAGSHCTSEGTVLAGINNGKSNTVYILSHVAPNGNTTLNRYYGENQISFGELDQIGIYTLTSRDTLTGCEATDSRQIRIGNTPDDVHYEGQGYLCSGEQTATVTVKLHPAQAAITYTLIKVPNGTIGTFGSPVADTLFFTGKLSEGAYIVKGQIGECAREYTDTIRVSKAINLGLPELLRPLEGCENNPPTISMNSSVPSVKYTLFLKGETDNQALETLSGDGNILTFQKQNRAGTYFIQAYDPLSGCSRTLYPEYTIEQLPISVNITGETEYCETADGVTIGIDTSEFLIKYQLQRQNANGTWENIPGGTLTGSGHPAQFYGLYPSGTYRVVAGNICKQPTNGTLTVSTISHPNQNLALKIQGNPCIDSTIVISAKNSESGMAYTLYYGDQAIGGSSQNGGGQLEWTIKPNNKGLYTVKTSVRECTVTLKDSIRVGLFAPIPSFKGDTLFCAGNQAEIYLQSYEADALYTLHSSPDGTPIVKGHISGNHIVFGNLQSGTYYVQAKDGDCVSTGIPQTIHSVTPPNLPQWELNDCVAKDSGRIIIHNMQSGYEYILNRQYGETTRLKNHSGEMILSALPLGSYTLFARDTVSGCQSPELQADIREGVYDDSLSGSLYYCYGETGAILTLSGVHREIEYAVKSLSGTLETIRYPENTFRPLLSGSYIFEKNRIGNLGGCSSQQSFVIQENAAPQTDLRVSINDTQQHLCAGGDYQVEIHHTEQGKGYCLQTSLLAIDTVYGNGSDQLFSQRISAEGNYHITVWDTITGCSNQLDTLLRIYPLPPKVKVEDCNFCQSETDIAGRCGISLKGMLPGHLYRLQQNGELDTLTGYGYGTFKARQAGTYRIIVEATASGCTDTLTGHITALPAPKQFRVTPICREIPAIIRIETDGSEGDTISYSLYKNGIATVVNSLPGTGGPIGFDRLSDAGTYRIQALNILNGCGNFMQDSVVLYVPRTEKDTLIVTGDRFCENATGASAILSIPTTTEGWKYYITNGLTNSDTLTGNGKIRSWTRFDGQPITGGLFELYAISPCGEEVYVARNRVETAPPPELYPLKNSHISLCPGSTFELALTNSDANTTYIVKRFNTSTNRLEKETRKVSPADGPLSLGQFDATGLYEISADNGCPSVTTHTIIIESGTLPDRLSLLGQDVCIGTDGSTMEISLPFRQEKVNYYLYADTIVVDSITITDLASGNSFQSQGQPGTYTVIARHTEDFCERKMDGTFFLHSSPEVKTLLPVNGDICLGESVCLQLESAENGVRYTILNENGNPVSEIAGTAGITPFKVGCVTEAGTYNVKASVSSCYTLMNGSQTVKTTELPYLSIQDNYHYCDGSSGVQIAVFSPTNPALTYRLYDPSGQLCETLPGSPDGDEISFKAMKIPGYYHVEAYDNATGCSAIDSVELIRDNRPDAIGLSVSGKGYICEGESVSITLDTTETGTLYTLYHSNSDEAVSGPVAGTGQPLTFPRKIKEAGTYYVEAMYENGLQCTHTFGSLTIYQANSLTPFRLIRQKSSYCVTDEAKGAIQLDGSQEGICYRLTRDGEFTGNDQWGNGTALHWNQLEGKPCNELVHNDDGYRYRIIALDTLSGCTRQMLGDDTITEVNPVVLLAQEPNDERMLRCEGTKVQFSATTIGCRETYTWYHNGGKIPGANHNFYNIDAVGMEDYGEYYCEITNACSNVVTTQPVSLEIRELVKVQTPLTDRAICDDKAPDIMLAAGFRNATSYRWYKTDDPQRTLSNSVYLELSGNDKTIMGQYVCVANNLCSVEVTDTCEILFGQTPDISFGELRTDTLCVGSIYDKLRITVGEGVTPQWYRGTSPLHFTGNRLILPAITKDDEGPYLVKASNVCGESTLHVGTLYVDDYMRVTDASDPTIIQCIGNSERLFVNIDPAERVKYTWEYTDGTRIENSSSQLLVGPFQEVTTQIYWVRFMNKCGMVDGDYNYREFVVHVPQPFVLPADLPSEIITCTETQDTVIRLHMDPSTYANYKWWYRKNKNDVSRTLLPSDTDTLAIPCRTSSTGFYYCDLSNECDAKTTETIWVRIDSIPVISGVLSDDTICEGGQLILKLPATGGGLHYDWHIQKKGNSNSEIITDIKEDYESIGELRLTATAAHDSCLIWCHVYNNCGEKFTNTMLLRVDKRRQVEISPADTTICSGSYAEIKLTLHNGSAPWCYHYTQTENPEIEETRIAEQLTDVLNINRRGTYVVTFVSDGGKCNYADGNSTFRINNYYVPEARIISMGKDTLCPGEKTQFKVNITYPPLPEGETLSNGPWEIVFVNSRSEIMNEILGVSNPLLLYRENGTADAITYTLPPFVLPQNQTIYIGSVKDLSAGDHIPCPGIGYDSIAFVISQRDRLQFDFRSAKDTIGICEQIQLDTLLNPNLPGSFFIDGIISQNNYLNASLAGEGKHLVRYETRGNCPASAEVNLWVTAAPQLNIIPADTSLCPGQSAELQLFADGCGPFRLKYEIRNEKRDGTEGTVNTFEKDLLPASVKISYSYYTDSLRTIQPLLLYDRFGCPATTLSTAQVHLLGYPDFELSGQYPETDGDNWKIVTDPYIIKKGDYVDYKIHYKEGLLPWYCEVITPGESSRLIGPIYGRDTIFRAYEEGRYQFTAVDAFYCMKPGYNKESFIFFREKGYLRIRTLLQGPFVERDGQPYMRADLQRLGILQREGLTNCPVSGKDSIVDVIVAELRENMDTSPVARDTFLLRNDGQLLTRTGNDTLIFTNTDKLMDANAYYIVLSHRNHLAVISNKAIPITAEAHKDKVISFDFTVAGAAYCPADSKPENHMILMNATYWTMAAGYPIVENELITISNPNLTKLAPENEVQKDYYGYYWRDVNLNGIVEFPTDSTPEGFIFNDTQIELFKTKDFWILHRNRNKFSAVPPVK